MKDTPAALALLALLSTVASTQPAARAPKQTKAPKSTTTAKACDATVWKAVYHPDRLPDNSDCRTITGTIKNFKAEVDGDYHIRLVVSDKSLVNAKNDQEQGGALVAEPICQYTPTQADAIQPCKLYKGPKIDMSKIC